MTPLNPNDVKTFLLRRFAATIRANGLNPADIGDDFDLLKAGVIDSLGVIEMISAVDEHFKITVDFERLNPAELTIIGSFSRFVAENAINSQPAS